MKKILILLPLIILTIITPGCHTKIHLTGKNVEANVKTRADSIEEAIDYQLKNYPCSQYRDVYKNFMQDFFGPGHILSDTAASGRYLRSELSEEVPFEGPIYEKTGFRGNFYRVNLSLIKEGIIPYDLFFDAFVESVRGITPPSGKEWMKMWGEIDSMIQVKKINFPAENEDRTALKEQFKRGDYVVHHSKRYNDSVHFHYRIISKEKFENTILPLIQQRNLHVGE
ncbi:MAG: hypothetical protein K2M10_03660 [Muribaculaceae bacterium]|nr:hypothetical protein [Muribaculaceae bacterium]